MVRFTATLVIISLLLIAVASSMASTIPSFFFQSLILLLVSTLGLYNYLLRVRERYADRFVQLYLLTIGVKLLAFGTYVGIIVWIDRESAVENVVAFLVMYLLFTGLEVGFLWQRISR